MYFIYNIIYIIGFIIYIPVLMLKGKWHKGYWQRMGFLPAVKIARLRRGKNIWVHAVSVGEVLVVSQLIRQLKRECPENQVVLTTVTKTGFELASKELKDDVVLFAPLDFSWIVRRFIVLVKPVVYVSAETELWPNLYHMLHRKGVAITIVNGRISTKSFRGYKRFQFFIQSTVKCVDHFCMQSEDDAQRIHELGADKDRVSVLGNLKFDISLPIHSVQYEDYGFSPDHTLFIAGSTHPGEEQIIIDIYKKLQGDFPDLRLVICPRHVERTKSIIQLAEKMNVIPIVNSERGSKLVQDHEILVIDSIGHLRQLYSLATIVFVGKSLCVGGGQNIIEPALFGKPVFIGPLTGNFNDVVAVFKKSNAVIQVNDAQELLVAVSKLLKNPQQLERVGSAAKYIVDQNRGATDRTVAVINRMIEARP